MKAILKINSSLFKQKEKSSAFSFSFVDDENRMIIRSETYRTKDSAKKGIRAVIKNANKENRYVLEKTTDGEFFFKLKSSNGIIVTTSAMFPTERDRQDAIDQLAALTPECRVEEQLIDKMPEPPPLNIGSTNESVRQ